MYKRKQKKQKSLVRKLVGDGRWGTLGRAALLGTAVGAASVAPGAIASNPGISKAYSAYKTARHKQGGSKTRREAFAIAKKIYDRNKKRGSYSSSLRTADFALDLDQKAVKAVGRVRNGIRERKQRKFNKTRVGHIVKGALYGSAAAVGIGAYRGSRQLGGMSRETFKNRTGKNWGFGARTVTGGLVGAAAAPTWWRDVAIGGAAGLGAYETKKRLPKRNSRRKPRK